MIAPGDAARLARRCYIAGSIRENSYASGHPKHKSRHCALSFDYFVSTQQK